MPRSELLAPSLMVRQVTLMRLRDGVTESGRDALLAALRALPVAINSIQSGEAVEDLRLEAGMWHLLLTFDFDSREKSPDYKADPAHTAAIERDVRPLVAEIARVQVGFPPKPQAA